MCFSPEADIAAGIVVGVIGIDAIRHVRRRSEMPLASLPLLFAGHQLTEAFVWWDLADRVPASMGRAALWVYMVFAYLVLPVLVPAAVLAVETDARRRRLLARLTVVGGAVALAYLAAMARGPVGVAIDGHSLNYDTGAGLGGPLAAVYALVVCGSLLASGHRAVVAFGFANVGAVSVLVWMSTQELTSLWCLWAAVTSVAIDAHLRGTSGVGEGGIDLRRLLPRRAALPSLAGIMRGKSGAS
jgi:hypothetical protein